ncbi:MAG: PilZ domain-containing protein [Candidatus Omnitrophica bacterium]|nr:PilZ domain-containing protein [Candidatus Omnitrophota bacterium]
MKEKRRFIRFEISLKVNFIVQKKDLKVEKTGITRDISAGGLQLLTEEKLENGNKLVLKVFIPGALNPAHLNGIVMWSKDLVTDKGPSYGAGIEFDDVEEDNKNTFLRFLCDLMYKKIGKLSELDNLKIKASSKTNK